MPGASANRHRRLRDPYDTRVLAVAIPLHLDQYREALPQHRARDFLGFIGQHAAIATAHVAPNVLVVFDLDLERARRRACSNRTGKRVERSGTIC